MQKYIESLESRIPDCLEVPWIKDNILDMLGGGATSMDIYRWRSLKNYPPIEMLVKLSEITRQPTSYLLGQTDVLRENDSTEIHPREISAVMKEKGMTEASLARRAGTTVSTITDLIEKFPKIRTNSLIAIAEALEVSTDYLLGLTIHRKWEDFTPFVGINPGEPARVERYDGSGKMVCLLGLDGKTVFAPDGKTYEVEDFQGWVVTPY